MFGIPVFGQETDYQKYHEEKLEEGVTDNQLIIYPGPDEAEDAEEYRFQSLENQKKTEEIGSYL